jgi:hypothetical protein
VSAHAEEEGVSGGGGGGGGGSGPISEHKRLVDALIHTSASAKTPDFKNRMGGLGRQYVAEVAAALVAGGTQFTCFTSTTGSIYLLC